MEACHSPQQHNVTSYGATSAAIISLGAFAGMWINAFIVCVLCTGWVQKKTLNSNEKILLLMGCSRISFLFFLWVYHFLSIIYPNYQDAQPIYQIHESLTNFSNYCNLWVSASLCVFYCIKIANFSNRFFIYLKVKIDRIVPWLLLGSVISALAVGVTINAFTESVQSNNITFTCFGNFGEASIRMEKHPFPAVFVGGFAYAASFLAVILSAVFLLFSLWRHKRKMQTKSMKNLSMDAHIKAMKSILSFLVIYSINFAGLMLAINYTMKNENTIKLLISTCLYVFPSVHSLILIFSNPKLEKALLKILPCVKCEFFMK